MLTKEELKANNNNVMVIMENRVMQMTGCNRETANLVANEILTLDAESEKLLSSETTVHCCGTCAFYNSLHFHCECDRKPTNERYSLSPTDGENCTFYE